jgi:hypothetical protein
MCPLSLPCSQQPATCTCPAPHQLSPCPHNWVCRIHFNIILSSMSRSAKWSHSLMFPHPNTVYTTHPANSVVTTLINTSHSAQSVATTLTTPLPKSSSTQCCHCTNKPSSPNQYLSHNTRSFIQHTALSLYQQTQFTKPIPLTQHQQFHPAHSVVTVPINPVHQTNTSHTTQAVPSTLGDERLDLKMYFNSSDFLLKAKSRFRLSFAILLPWRPSFNTRTVYVGILVDKVSVGKVLFWVLLLVPVSIIPSILHTCSLICHQHYIILA